MAALEIGDFVVGPLDINGAATVVAGTVIHVAGDKVHVAYVHVTEPVTEPMRSHHSTVEAILPDGGLVKCDIAAGLAAGFEKVG